ncbi:Rep1 [Hyposoter didymator ichnovirus]|nr:Rep1 [Hyposoter didymator ichnovirus]
MSEVERPILMSLRKCVPSWLSSRKASRNRSRPPALPQLPCDIFLYMSQFLEFQDYWNLIEAFFPNGDEDDLIQQRIWKLSTRRILTRFFDPISEPLEIEYNYDANRSEKDRILWNVESLLPITGPIFPEDPDKLWMSVPEIVDIVSTRYDMYKCSDYGYVNCNFYEQLFEPVTYPNPLNDRHPIKCPYGHYHHYCTHDVIYWFTDCISFSVREQEEEPAVAENEMNRRGPAARLSEACFRIIGAFGCCGKCGSFRYIHRGH